MTRVSLGVPAAIAGALPADGDDAEADMERAVSAYEELVNDALAEDTDSGVVVDVIEHFERRWEAYDDYVVELRAWGQSPIYAMAWRDLHASLIEQLYQHDGLADEIDRERHARLVDDGIRFDA